LEQEKVASTLPNGKYLEIKDATHFSLATEEVHLSSIQYLLKQLIQASLSLSIRYYFFKANDNPIKLSIPVLILS
jgi:hypothetical protein